MHLFGLISRRFAPSLAFHFHQLKKKIFHSIGRCFFWCELHYKKMASLVCDLNIHICLFVTFFYGRSCWTWKWTWTAHGVHNWFVYLYFIPYIYRFWKVIELKFHPHAFDKGQRTDHQDISFHHTINYMLCQQCIVDVLSHHMIYIRHP